MIYELTLILPCIVHFVQNFQGVLQVPGGEVEPVREVRGGQPRDDKGEGELERRAEGRQGG